MALEGFDLVVLGTVTPELLEYEPWGLTPGQAEAISSWGLVGVMVGALGVATVTDMIGRRRTIMACMAWFSVFAAACALAPSPGVFGVLRFLAGLGLGGVLPATAALVSEYAGALARELRRRGGGWGLAAICIGVGQGLAVVLEA